MTQSAMQFHGFHIDLPCSDEDYLFVDVRGFSIAMILTDEGIVVDIYPQCVADEPIASTWACYSELSTCNGEQP